jgi:hypothetical protein
VLRPFSPCTRPLSRSAAAGWAREGHTPLPGPGAVRAGDGPSRS